MVVITFVGRGDFCLKPPAETVFSKSYSWTESWSDPNNRTKAIGLRLNQYFESKNNRLTGVCRALFLAVRMSIKIIAGWLEKAGKTVLAEDAGQARQQLLGGCGLSSFGQIGSPSAVQAPFSSKGGAVMSCLGKKSISNVHHESAEDAPEQARCVPYFPGLQAGCRGASES